MLSSIDVGCRFVVVFVDRCDLLPFAFVVVGCLLDEVVLVWYRLLSSVISWLLLFVIICCVVFVVVCLLLFV